MNLGETIRRRPRAALAAGGVAAAVLAALIGLSMRGTSASPSMPGRFYFTTDDGKTYFADDSARLPPFDRGGQTAVQAIVFRCGGGDPFVGYLLRYTPRGLAELAKFPRGRLENFDPQVTGVKQDNAEVKAPGQGKWLPAGAPAAGRLLSPACPGGGGDLPQQVLP